MTATQPLPDRELVRRLLRYDAATGEFIWLPRPREMFPGNVGYRVWNAQNADKVAGFREQSYYRIVINKRMYLAHRIAWLYAYGEPVPAIIDHIDGNPFNNRLNNLRAATSQQSLANRGRAKNNTTGIKGVYRNARGGFRARICHNGKTLSFGTFSSLEEAAGARRKAAELIQGEFAKHG